MFHSLFSYNDGSKFPVLFTERFFFFSFIFRHAVERWCCHIYCITKITLIYKGWQLHQQPVFTGLEGELCADKTSKQQWVSQHQPRRQHQQNVQLSFQLTLLDARRDGDEGHEATEGQVDPEQCLVEVAGDGVCVVLVHEGKGHGCDGVEEEGGAHYGQVPALVLSCSSQPAGGITSTVANGQPIAVVLLLCCCVCESVTWPLTDWHEL